MVGYGGVVTSVSIDKSFVGLREFLSVAREIDPNLSELEFISGRTEVPDGLRAFTLLYHLPKVKDHKNPHPVLALVVKPGGQRFDRWNFARCLYSQYDTDIFSRTDGYPIGVASGKLQDARPGYLSQIGMREQMCHPFPSRESIARDNGDASIDRVFMDESLLGRGSMIFPIYGDLGRVGSIRMTLEFYRDVQMRNLGVMFDPIRLSPDINYCDHG